MGFQVEEIQFFLWLKASLLLHMQDMQTTICENSLTFSFKLSSLFTIASSRPEFF